MKSKKIKPVEHAEVTAVRPTHERTGASTDGMSVTSQETIVLTYKLDILGASLFADREAAIEMYAQMAATSVRELLTPIQVRR
jgi:hypothetical protein